MTTPPTVRDAVVLVTGANGGLGEHFVEQALRRGARKVYATARRPRSWTDDRVVPLSLDVTDPDSVAAAAAAADDVTILINNAGTTGARRLVDADLDEIRSLYETNVFGVLATSQAFAPTLAANGGGAIVNLASVLSWLPFAGAYPSTKAAVWALTNSLRIELADQGTYVASAHLAFTDTPMTAALDVAKADPADAVAAILDGLEAGDREILADAVTRQVKAGLDQQPEVA